MSWSCVQNITTIIGPFGSSPANSNRILPSLGKTPLLLVQLLPTTAPVPLPVNVNVGNVCIPRKYSTVDVTVPATPPVFDVIEAVTVLWPILDLVHEKKYDWLPPAGITTVTDTELGLMVI